MKNTLLLLLFTLFTLSSNLYAIVNIPVVETSVPLQTKDKKDFYVVSSIPENSVKILKELNTIKNNITSQKKVLEVHKALPSFADSIDDILKTKEYQEIESLNVRTMQKMHTEISIYLTRLNEWDSLLKTKIELYDKNKKQLTSHADKWQKTKINAKEHDAPKAVKKNIILVIKSIESTLSDVKKNYDLLLTDSSKINSKILDIQNTLKSLTQNEQILKNRIFYQNEVPLFELLRSGSFSLDGVLVSFTKNQNEELEEIKYYFINSTSFEFTVLYSIFLAVLIIYYFYLSKKKTLFIFKESRHKRKFRFIRLPISTFFVILSLSIVLIYIDRPKSVNDMILFFLLLPTLRILHILFPLSVKKYVYIFFSILIVFLLKNNIVGFEIYTRIITLFLSLGFIASFIFFIKQKIFKNLFDSEVNSIINTSLVIFSIFMMIAFIANIYGAVLLSYRIEQGVILSLYASLIFYVVYVVLSGYIVIFLRRRISTASYMLDKYSRNLESTTILLIKITLILWWIKIILVSAGLYPYALDLANNILGLSWDVASTTISIQSIFDFLLVIFFTWALSKIIKMILEVEIYSRFKFPRGIPTAISTTFNYIIIITGTIIAFSSLGITAQQFTIVFGALGVGIGFGLRNIIANFISGIIMVFERPIQIGDTIEITNTMGDVQSIGARSSTIKTYDGSEVIIPNADFISKEIINWTLSDNRRRKTILFKVDFDSDIELVLQIMQEIALSHNDVLKDPQPQAVFLGFGEYYLEFKLYFWLSENIIGAQSELAISIYKKLKEEGVNMPIPKAKYELTS